MKYQITKGSQSVILPIYIQDLSSAIGVGLTGVTPSTSGIKAYWKKNTDATPTAFNLAVGTVGTYVASGLVAVSNANAPGDYELCLPNAAFSDGTDNANVFLTATLYNIPNALPVKLDIQLKNTESISEPSIIPNFPCTVSDMISFMFQRAHNKSTCTDSDTTVYKSDDTTVLGTATLADDGSTLVRSQYS